MSTTDMKPKEPKEERLSFRVPEHIKHLIEEAACEEGLTLTGFAIATLTERARAIMHTQRVTRLTKRDQALLLEMLDDETLQPNEALRKAAERYNAEVIDLGDKEVS